MLTAAQLEKQPDKEATPARDRPRARERSTPRELSRNDAAKSRDLGI
jgi:hypothetical protein